MNFTKEEISLCKQIYRKHGEILDTTYKPSDLSWEELAKIIKDAREMQSWAISDCLEFLREKGYRVSLDEDLVAVESFHAKCYGHKNKITFHNFGKTYLEACLKAVLAVLKEK